jgi:hypothetical protein
MVGTRLAAIACAVLLTASPAAAQQTRYLVVPGVGIGPIKLGMSIATVAQMLGEPTPSDDLLEPGIPELDGTHGYSWRDRHIFVETNRAGTVYYVGVAMPGVVTSEGFGYGTDMDEVQDRLGVPSRTVPVGNSIRMIYDELGVQFAVSMLVGTDHYHKVDAVGVFAPRQ